MPPLASTLAAPSAPACLRFVGGAHPFFVALALGSLVLPVDSRAQAGAPDGGSDAAPVIVAVDTSRSLDAAALGEVTDRLRLALEALPASTPTALLAFDDEPRWLESLGASPGEVAAELQSLKLQGNFTLLNDALFFATRALPEGGVVLLATDGRDENSAVVVDDIARRCEEQDVRIVSLGTGRAVEERALRRLALLSNGAYLGRVDSVDASAIASSMKSSLAEVEAARRAAATARPAAPRGPAGVGPGSVPGSAPASAAGGPTPATGGTPAGAGAPPAAGAPSVTGGAPGPSTSPTSSTWWANPYLLGGLGLAFLLLLFTLGRRRGKETAELLAEDAAGQEIRDQEAADEAEAQMIRVELAQAEAANPRESPEVTVDTAVYQKMSFDERLERTQVLSNHSILVMRKLGERPRSFMLDGAKAFAVGRDRHKNTLAVPDPALSSEHFKIVPRDEEYFFIDLESTNGSYVNGRPVSAKRLRHGDVIRAGQVEFELQTYSNV